MICFKEEKRVKKRIGLGLCALSAGLCLGATQTWYDAGTGFWSLSDLNWDAGAAAWAPGNTALFQGAGGRVILSGTNSVSGITFDTDGYVIASTNTDGAITFAANETPINVATGMTATISANLAPGSTFIKTGLGTLVLTGTNAPLRDSTAAAGIVKLAPNNIAALQSDFGILEGATLDLNGCFASAAPTNFWCHPRGSGFGGQGALINSGASHVNRTFGCSFEADATIGGPSRIDISDIYLQDHTLTKIGSCQLCVRHLHGGGDVIIKEGEYTQFNGDSLGGTATGDTFVYASGQLDMWGNSTVTERITFNGGRLTQGWGTTIYTGHITFNGPTSTGNGDSTEIRLQGLIDGPGPLSIKGDSTTLSTYQNQLSGPILNSSVLRIGTIGGTSGTFGTCTAVTNANDNASIYYDRADSLTVTNPIAGGNIYVRFGGELIFDGGCYVTNAVLGVPQGFATFKNCKYDAPNKHFYVGPRWGLPYTLTNSWGTINIQDGADITVSCIEGGNGNGFSYTNAAGQYVSNTQSGIVNQAGGTFRTVGAIGDPNMFPGEYDGIHFGHYPNARTIYNLTGGRLIIGNGYRLAIAVDGSGWFYQSGGEAWTDNLTLNARDADYGYGEYHLTGGVMNIGTNGISSGIGSRYLVALGGGTGGVIRAKSSFSSALNMSLLGTNAAEAVTFEAPEGGSVTLSGILSGNGGFNKAGSGLLTLTTSAETCTGPATVKAGTLALSVPNQLQTSTAVTVDAGASLDLGATTQVINLGGRGSVTNGWTGEASVINPGTDGQGTLTFDGTASIGGLDTTIAVTVSANGSCGVLALNGNLDLDNQTVTVTNPDALDKTKVYTFATTTGTFTGKPTVNVPSPWFVVRGSDTLRLSAFSGTVIRFD